MGHRTAPASTHAPQPRRLYSTLTTFLSLSALSWSPHSRQHSADMGDPTWTALRRAWLGRLSRHAILREPCLRRGSPVFWLMDGWPFGIEGLLLSGRQRDWNPAHRTPWHCFFNLRRYSTCFAAFKDANGRPVAPSITTGTAGWIGVGVLAFHDEAGLVKDGEMNRFGYHEGGRASGGGGARLAAGTFDASVRLMLPACVLMKAGEEGSEIWRVFGRMAHCCGSRWMVPCRACHATLYRRQCLSPGFGMSCKHCLVGTVSTLKHG